MPTELPLFVDPQTLARVRAEPDVQIVAVDPAEAFADSHIEGARRVDLAALVATRPPTEGLLPDAEVVARVCSSLGLSNDATIVAYDRAGDAQAARFLYTLDAMGHDRIALLDGGLKAWAEAGLALVDGVVTPEPSHFTATRRATAIADKDWIERSLDASEVAFVDVRGADEYAGRDVRSARGGHLPGAVHLDWTTLKNADGRLKPRAELDALLAEAGVRPDQELATYCQSHMRSSYSYLVFKALGYPGVRGYPGAWSDWGNREDTPIETGDPGRG